MRANRFPFIDGTTPIWRLMSRRNWLAISATSTVAPLLVSTPMAVAAEDYRPLNRFPRMVQDYFVAEVRRVQRRRQSVLETLRTAEDVQRYLAEVRRKIRLCFGPEPRRTPLNAQITGRVERDAYTIEKLIFESRPGLLVTANLYLPKGRETPLPGVVGTCGHSANGKAAAPYQSFAQGLARLGYVCLIYDPIGQGERLQYVDPQLKPLMRPGVTEHLHEGNQQFLVGEFLGMWRAWDGIRALDYLLTRPEVDPRHVGVTGNSGGGTMSTWLCGLERRWTMAAPACFVTTFRRNLENELPADTEQCPPRALALGLDHADFVAAMAPKPVIVLAKERDFFDIRGTEHAMADLEQVYRLLETEEQVALHVGPTTHGFSQENREAMYRWFNRVTGTSDAQSEPPIELEDDATLWCTPQGQVAELGSRTVFDFTKARSQELTRERGRVARQRLQQAVRRVLRLKRSPEAAPDFRILRYLHSRGYPAPHAIAYAVESEPHVQAIVYMLSQERWYSRPPQTGPRAILYVAHRSSDHELRHEPLIEQLMSAETAAPLFTCDVRGIGESQPETCGINSFDDPYGSDYFYAIHSLMLDRPYLGQRTFDVLRVIDWLVSFKYQAIHVVGSGWGALAATFAALLHPSVTQVTLKHALQSYADVAETADYAWPLALLPMNVLTHFDLPDCYRALESKQLRQIEPWDARAHVVPGPTG